MDDYNPWEEAHSDRQSENNEMYALLGRYVSEFEKLMSMLRGWLDDNLTMEEFDEFQASLRLALVTELSERQVYNVLRTSLSALYDKENGEDYKNVIKKIDTCINERNKIVHSEWRIDVHDEWGYLNIDNAYERIKLKNTKRGLEHDSEIVDENYLIEKIDNLKGSFDFIIKTLYRA